MTVLHEICRSARVSVPVVVTSTLCSPPLEVFMAIRVGIDVACRTAHRAACADASGQLLWRNVRFQTNAEDLEELCRRLPDGEKDITVAPYVTQKDHPV